MTDSTITLKLDPDALDSTTSPSSPSEEIIENEKSPSGSLNLDSKDSEDLSINSKKIRKKRTAYHKIDDEIRIKLLEAVHNGETLKSAAKRYRINYSSAKSVLHTYRKEGRIFKKSGQDTPFEANNTINFIQAPSINLNQSMFYPMQNLTDVSPNSRLLQFQPSPTHGLVDNFMSKLKLESQQNAIEEGLRSHPNQQQQQFPRLNQLLGSQDKTPVSNSFPRGVNVSPMSNVNIPPMFQANNPLEKLKYLDGFYMNYSNSPLSNCDRITADTSCGSSRRYLKSNNPKEFESFSDMVNSLQQAHPLQSEEMYASQPPRLNPAAAVQMLQEREEANWSGKIENAAIDTYKTFMDAQNLLKDALKKASYLNNLMHIQKTQSESPLNGQFFNHLSH